MSVTAKGLKNLSVSDLATKFVVYLIVFGVCLAIVFPFLHILAISTSHRTAVTRLEVGLFPVGFNLDAYLFILSDPIFPKAFLNSIFYTVATTFFAVLFDTMAAYAFTRTFYGKKLITYFFIIPMYFTGGLIPTYLLISKYLKWTDSYLAMIVPFCFTVFYMIVLRSQIENIPPSLVEAAKVDGANEGIILGKIVIPAISSSLAAIGMFTALNAWNMWFPIMLYSSTNQLWNLQYYLRTIVFDRSFMQMSSTANSMNMVFGNISPKNIQMAAVILVALPVVMVYPFVQKYFVSGLLLGSVKE